MSEEYVAKQCRGSLGDEATSKRHARFAASCAVNCLLSEQDVWAVAEEWGQANGITQAGGQCVPCV